MDLSFIDGGRDEISNGACSGSNVASVGFFLGFSLPISAEMAAALGVAATMFLPDAGRVLDAKGYGV
jgi:Ca2+/Na+ antiporter